MNEVNKIRPPLDAWLPDWTANKRYAVLAKLAQPSIRDYAFVKAPVESRLDSVAVVLVLREFLAPLPPDEADTWPSGRFADQRPVLYRARMVGTYFLKKEVLSSFSRSPLGLTHA